MITPTLKELKERFRQLNYQWPEFHLIGIRAKDYVPNTFCDQFILCSGGVLYRFKGTTRPGSYYLLHLLNPKGAAVLKPGQYVDSFVLGKHQGKYTAWVQAKPLPVYRDGDKDKWAEEQGPTDVGFFGINIHRASAFTISKLVDKWSAGCQVIASPQDFDILIKFSQASKQRTFTYTLLNEFLHESSDTNPRNA